LLAAGPLDASDTLAMPQLLQTGQFSAAANASYPGKLPALLSAFLDGQDIDEPFELRS
jgi:hypothetical protein